MDGPAVPIACTTTTCRPGYAPVVPCGRIFKSNAATGGRNHSMTRLSTRRRTCCLRPMLFFWSCIRLSHKEHTQKTYMHSWTFILNLFLFAWSVSPIPWLWGCLVPSIASAVIVSIFYLVQFIDILRSYSCLTTISSLFFFRSIIRKIRIKHVTASMLTTVCMEMVIRW